MKPLRLALAVDRFLAMAAKTVAPATFALYRHYLQQFLAHAGDVDVASIAPVDVLGWNPRYHPAGCVRRLFRWLTVEARVLASIRSRE